MNEFIDWLIHIAPAISALAAIAAFTVSLSNRRRIQSVHVDINGRLSQLLEAARREGVSLGALQRAEGIAQGEQDERDRQAPPPSGAS